MKTFKYLFKLCFILISFLVLLFFGVRYCFWESLTEIGALSYRWNLDIPRSAKVEEFYKSVGVRGDGWRLLVVSCNVKKIKGTVLDYTKYHDSLDLETMEVIDKIYAMFLKKNPSHFNVDSGIKVKKIQKEKPLEDSDISKKAYSYCNVLVIIYDVVQKRYYIFEEIL